MRTVRILILRLLIDKDAPEALRGTVQRVTDSQAQPFATEQALLSLLHQWARSCPGAAPLDRSNCLESPEGDQDHE